MNIPPSGAAYHFHFAVAFAVLAAVAWPANQPYRNYGLSYLCLAIGTYHVMRWGWLLWRKPIYL